MAQITADGIDLQDPRITDYPGTGQITAGLMLVRNPATGTDHRAPASRITGSGLPAGTVLRDPYDVPTAKALQVIADYQTAQGPFMETDPAYYNARFDDDYTSSGDEFMYWCKPSRPVSTGGATVWKWKRYLEAGI